MDKIRHVTLVTKKSSENAAKLGKEIAAFFHDHDVSVRVLENGAGIEPRLLLEEDLGDLVLILGGDGTFIGTARTVLETGVPLLGINLGRVGFLTEISRLDWREKLSRIIHGQARVRELLSLEYEVLRGDERVAHGVGINDLVIHRGTLARLINIDLYLNGEHLSEVRADGIIAATPTGSTAYSISSGGPVLHPDLFVWSVVPICPFLNNVRPLVLPKDAEIRAEILPHSADTHVTVDGQVGLSLQGGDQVRLRAAEKNLRLAALGDVSYPQKLKCKHIF
jgi:NAD+ kinase